MSAGPLAGRWNYDLGDRKIFELRSALGLDAEGPAPRGAVFAYAVTPALARILTHPHVAVTRDVLRISRLEVAFASEVDMRDQLDCSVDVRVGNALAGVVSCIDRRGARVVATVHLDRDESPPSRGFEVEDVVELRLDPARSIAFAAATWDLNPAYWDVPFAEVAGLGGLVAPPGLAVSLALEEIERRWGRPVSALDVRFERAGRPGDTLMLGLGLSGNQVFFEARAGADVVVQGDALLGASTGPL